MCKISVISNRIGLIEEKKADTSGVAKNGCKD